MGSNHDDSMCLKIIADLKKEGKYDEIRRNIADDLVNDTFTPALQNRVKAEIEKMLETVLSSTRKDELRTMVKEQLANGGFTTKVEAIARERTHDMKLYETLRTEISNRVRIQLGLVVKEEEPEEDTKRVV